MARQSSATREDDEALLRILEMRDAGLSMAQIGKAIGRSRAAVSGIFYRIDHDYFSSEGDE